MALAAVENLRHVQAGRYSGDIPLRIVEEEPISADTFFRLLDTRRDEPIPDTTFDVPVPVEFLQPGIQQLKRIARSPELRRTLSQDMRIWNGQSRKSAVEIRSGRKAPSFGDSHVVEVGRNRVLNPVDNKSYSAPILWGEEDSLPALFPHLRQQNREGKITIASEHTHHGNHSPIHSISDLSIFFIPDSHGRPLLNEETVYGDFADIYAFRTDKTRGLLLPSDVEDLETDWHTAFDAAGGTTKTRWEQTLMTMGGARYQREKAQFETYIQPYQDEVLATYAEWTGLKFLISINGEPAIAKPPGRIIQQVREQQQQFTA
jgi:hypothetical protein